MSPLRRAAAVAALAVAGCAHIESPTGGPVPDTPIQVVATRPDTGAVVPGWRGPVVIVFDRTLSEAEVQTAVSLSPRRGSVAVDHRGATLRVQPRQGWLPGTIYQVEVSPSLRDRFGNRMEERVRVVFSTGPEIPETRAEGVVTDRIRGEAAVDARIDAIRLPDSLTYTVRADSAGRFELERIPEGEYVVLAYRDANRNLRPDPFEARDSGRVTVAIGAAPTLELALLLPDTTPPRLGSARVTEGWVELRFDDYLDPEQPLSPEQVTLTGPDGSALPVAALHVGEAPPTSPAADEDTLAAESPPAAEPADTVPADTLPAEAEAPRRPLPAQTLFARPAVELLPDTLYTVTVRGVVNLHGLEGGGEAPLRTPRAPPPREAEEPEEAPAAEGAEAPPPAPEDAPPAPEEGEGAEAPRRDPPPGEVPPPPGGERGRAARPRRAGKAGPGPGRGPVRERIT